MFPDLGFATSACLLFVLISSFILQIALAPFAERQYINDVNK